MRVLHSKILLSLVVGFAPLFIGASTGDARDSGTVICRESAIEGSEELKDKAINIIGDDTTTDPSNVKIFVTVKDGEAYVQSNFRSKNPDYDPSSTDPSKRDHYSLYPTKLFTTKSQRVKDYTQAIRNIVFWGDPQSSYNDPQQVLEAALAHATVYVDQSALDQHGRPPFDLSGASTVMVVDSQSKETLAQAELLPVREPPPSLIERIAGCCFYGRPPGHGRDILARLERQPFQSKNTSFISLFEDSGTAAAIAASPHVKAIELRDRQDLVWHERLDAALAASKGKSLVIIAHTEHESLVIRDARGVLKFQASVQDIVDRAAAANVQLVLLGCETASFVHEQSSGLGVIGQYRSTDAVSKLEIALSQARSARQFYESLSGENLKLVVEADDSRTASLIKGKVMAKVNSSRPFWAQIARVLMLLPRRGS